MTTSTAIDWRRADEQDFARLEVGRPIQGPNGPRLVAHLWGEVAPCVTTIDPRDGRRELVWRDEFPALWMVPSNHDKGETVG